MTQVKNEVTTNKENLTATTGVFENPLRGYTAERLLNIIVGKEVSKAAISKKIPTGVRHHASYVIDLEAIGCRDILSFGDDNGSWGGHTKPRRKYIVELSEQLGVLSVQQFKPNKHQDEPDPNDVYTLYRNYFTHSHTPEFRKMIATVHDHDGSILPLAVIQYYFEGAIEVPITMPKHGNAKKQEAQPYMRTSRPVLQTLKEKCETKSYKIAVDECFDNGGGSIGKTAKRHDFYDVLELVNEGTFVKDFGFSKSNE